MRRYSCWGGTRVAPQAGEERGLERGMDGWCELSASL